MIGKNALIVGEREGLHPVNVVGVREPAGYL